MRRYKQDMVPSTMKKKDFADGTGAGKTIILQFYIHDLSRAFTAAGGDAPKQKRSD
jgi:hypothetical protein